jgi:hypothetical protein
MTRAQVKAWQESEPRKRDWNGALLDADGDLGPRTKWAMAIDDLPLFRRVIVRTACFYRGTIESPPGSNRGALIDEWVRNAGGIPGDPYPDPWCAAFVYMLLTQAGVPCRRTMKAKHCLEQFELVPEGEFVYPGDLAGWVNDDGTGHVFPVIGITPEGVAAMEGNSDNRVRLTSRVREGLQFRRVTCESFGYAVKDAPLIVRATAGTR